MFSQLSVNLSAEGGLYPTLHQTRQEGGPLLPGWNIRWKEGPPPGRTNQGSLPPRQEEQRQGHKLMGAYFLVVCNLLAWFALHFVSPISKASNKHAVIIAIAIIIVVCSCCWSVFFYFDYNRYNCNWRRMHFRSTVWIILPGICNFGIYNILRSAQYIADPILWNGYLYTEKKSPRDRIFG